MKTQAARILIFLIVSSFCVSCQKSSYRKDSLSNTDSASGSDSQQSGAKRVESLVQPKKRTVVLGFLNDTPIQSEDLGSFVSEELKRGLVLTGRVVSVPEDRTEIATSSFVQGAQIRVGQLIREGRRLGVSVLVVGRISKIAFRQKGDDVGLFRKKQSIAAADVEAKVFDVEQGREVSASFKSGEASVNALVLLEGGDLETASYRNELIQGALREAASKLIPDVIKAVDKMTWQGRIAKIQGSKIFVNSGRSSGLLMGDILRVLGPGDDVYDPTSGAFLGHTPGQLKGTLEINDFLGTDAAITQLHTGGNFVEGDVVQLY